MAKLLKSGKNEWKVVDNNAVLADGVKNTLKRALEQSDKDVVERFKQARVAQLNNGVIGIAIAQKDVRP